MISLKTPVAIGLLAGVLALALRLPGLGAILTADEPQWIFRSQAFYRALAAGDPGGTFQGTHPGVVPMLLIGGAVRAQELLTGVPLVSPTVGPFRTAAKAGVAVGVSVGIGLAAGLAVRLWGRATGLLMGALLAVDPFFLGHAQLAHVDALLAILMLLSLLVLLLYARTGARRLLICSGVVGGLAILTKLPALLLFPLVLLLLLVSRGREPSSTEQAQRDVPAGSVPSPGRHAAGDAPEGPTTRTIAEGPLLGVQGVSSASPLPGQDVRGIGVDRRKWEDPVRQDPLLTRRTLASVGWPRSIGQFFIWSAAVLLTFFLLWPSMWLNFFPNLRYFGRDAQSVAAAPPLMETAEAPAGGAEFYLRALVARTPPVILLLTLAGAALGVARRGILSRRETFSLLALTVGLFLLLWSVGKRGDRYFLPGLLPLDVLAATALAPLLTRGGLGRALVGALVLGLGIQALTLRPYALAYFSPIVWREEPTQSGWGEGLERVAARLNAHPLAEQLTVATWYPAVFQEFFRGTTMGLSSRGDHRVTHVVTYRNMRGRSSDSLANAVLAEFKERAPILSVSVRGREIAWVYETDSVVLYPEHVGELVAPKFAGSGGAIEVGQFVESGRDGLAGVRLVFATFSSRRNTADVLVHLREDPDGADLRTVRLNAAELEDRAWREISFAPIPDSAGKRYYLAVTSPNGRPGNAVTLQFQPKDILPGALVLLRTPLAAGESREEFTREGDIAYRLLYAGS